MLQAAGPTRRWSRRRVAVIGTAVVVAGVVGGRAIVEQPITPSTCTSFAASFRHDDRVVSVALPPQAQPAAPADARWVLANGAATVATLPHSAVVLLRTDDGAEVSFEATGLALDQLRPIVESLRIEPTEISGHWSVAMPTPPGMEQRPFACGEFST